MSLSPVARSSTFTQSLLLAAVGVTALGQTLVFTLLPSLGRATGLAEIQVGLIISCSSLAFALASPVWGYLSELYGRRPILIIGLSGYAIGTLLFALVFQTIDFRVDHLHAPTPGKAVICHASCYRLTPNVTFVRLTTWEEGEEEGEPVATGLATYTRMKLDKNGRVVS